MAKKFGGTFSPDQKTNSVVPTKTAAMAKAGFRARLMFLVPLPLLFTGFGQISAGNSGGIIRDFGAFVVLILAAWMLREGLIAEAAYAARRQASRPALPRKILAAILCGIGVGIAAFGMSDLLLPAVIAILAIILHLVAFGLDPLKNKGQSGSDSHQGRRVARAIEDAEEHVTDMNKAMARLKDRSLHAQLDAFVQAVRAMFRTIEDDPRDLTSARKYLSVYLMGARDATVKFVDLFEKTGDETVRNDYEELLRDLQKNFDAQRAEMLLDDRSDLDVEIEVLRERLRHEGVVS